MAGSHDGHSPATGLPIGSQAPGFDLPGPDGERLTLAGLRSAGRPVLVVFADPDCEPCQSLLPELARWQADYPGQLTTALISRGTITASRAWTARHGVRNVATAGDEEIATAYRSPGTPSAVVITPQGQIASPTVAGVAAIRSLAAAALRQTAPTDLGQPRLAPALRAGTPAPAAELPDLDGVRTSVTANRHGQVLVLFWNPGCGFCQQALDDIRARERGPVGFVLVSAGDAASNRAMGLTSQVLLDPDFAIARAFGASGTPSAILVGADQIIASDLAVGAPAVLRLADQAISAAQVAAAPGG